jgi:hypothetical protein
VSIDRPEDARERDGAGPMIVILIAAALMCAGSIGGGAYFVWRARNIAVERELEAVEGARLAAEERAAAAAVREQFEKIARALAKRLKSPDGLRDSYSAEGKPLLSWRVHLLPELGEAELYQLFKLDESWDGPTNRKLLERIPDAYDYHGPRKEWMNGGTYIRGFSHTGAIFEPRAEFAFADISSPDRTLAIFDSSVPVEWTRPDTIDKFDLPDPPATPRVGGSLPMHSRFLAAMVSGRVVWIDRNIRSEILRHIANRRHDAKWDQMAREWLE